MTCPETEKVTAILRELGLFLTFQMDEVKYPVYSTTPDLPAQYHFEDECGTEVIYLAGRDANTEGIRLPAHASRFWLYPGADAVAYQRVASILTERWSLAWQPADTPQSRQEAA